jgi:hypothetical protein
VGRSGRKRRPTDAQGELPFLTGPSNRERTVEIHCANCQAHFVAYYGTKEDAKTETIEVEKCGLCGGDPLKRDNFKDCALRLMAEVTARNVKRG